MGYLLIDHENATSNVISTNASSTVLKGTATLTKAAAAHSSLNGTSMFVSQPAEMDVLCGQDRNFIQHPGNKLYRSVIATWSERYGQAFDKHSKMRMTSEICKYMKEKHKSRFLKPISMIKESKSDESSNLGDFRWKVLTDQAARDKISHALRTSVGASRKRQERRRQMKAAKDAQQNKHKHQLAYSQEKDDHPKPKLQADQLRMASPQSMHGNMQSSFASIPESPPSNVWHGYSSTIDLHKYEPVLPMSSMLSFDSAADRTSLSSSAHCNDVWDFDPIPLSSRGSFIISAEMATSISQLLCDDDSD